MSKHRVLKAISILQIRRALAPLVKHSLAVAALQEVVRTHLLGLGKLAPEPHGEVVCLLFFVRHLCQLLPQLLQLHRFLIELLL